MPPLIKLMRLAPLVLLACGTDSKARESVTSTIDGAHRAALADSVRAFAASVSRGVTAQGPSAWRAYFADDSAFFMVAEGQLVFPNSDAATRGIAGLAHMIAHIELRWGDTVLVDALAPGLALVAMPYHETRRDARGHQADEDGFFTGLVERRGTGWVIRDAHWSVRSAPSPVP